MREYKKGVRTIDGRRRVVFDFKRFWNSSERVHLCVGAVAQYDPKFKFRFVEASREETEKADRRVSCRIPGTPYLDCRLPLAERAGGRDVPEPCKLHHFHFFSSFSASSRSLLSLVVRRRLPTRRSGPSSSSFSLCPSVPGPSARRVFSPFARYSDRTEEKMTNATRHNLSIMGGLTYKLLVRNRILPI